MRHDRLAVARVAGAAWVCAGTGLYQPGGQGVRVPLNVYAARVAGRAVARRSHLGFAVGAGDAERGVAWPCIAATPASDRHALPPRPVSKITSDGTQNDCVSFMGEIPPKCCKPNRCTRWRDNCLPQTSQPREQCGISHCQHYMENLRIALEPRGCRSIPITYYRRGMPKGNRAIVARGGCPLRKPAPPALHRHIKDAQPGSPATAQALPF